MKKKIIQLPKGYLSYSQIALWKADKERYKEIYFNGRDELRVSNSGMEYGKIVANAIEIEVETGDLLTDTAMEFLPKYDIRDQEIKTALKTKDGEIAIIGRPDTMDSKTFAIREYKTGKVKWTQKKAQGSLQIKFYAMIIYLAYGRLLREAYLDWIETTDTPEGIKPTGHVESFKVTLTLTDILNTMTLTSRVAKEIESAWVTYIPPAEVPF